MSAGEVKVDVEATTQAQLERVGLLALAAPAVEEPAPPPVDLSAVDVQAIRLLLGGGSVVDWRRLNYRDREEVLGFLAVNGFDIARPHELRRLHDLHQRAVRYVEETFDLDIPPRVRSFHDPCDVFLAASGDNAWEQHAACAVLKVMHVINHLEARRLIHCLSISERELFRAAAAKVDTFIRRMDAEGLGVVTYEPSTKTEHSLVSKLLSKPRVTAAQIFDKLRFRLVVRERDDLVPVVLWLTRHLFPFNHVIAGESHNTILTPTELARRLEGCCRQEVSPWLDAPQGPPERNPATSRSYRMINFVVELPVRLDRLVSTSVARQFQNLGHLMLVTLEFQIFDQATAEANEKGDGNHLAYKGRQLEMVATRLWGEDAPPLSPPEP